MSAHLEALKAEIVRRARAGEEVDVIERDLIAPLRVPEEGRAALWLLAWVEHPRAAEGAYELVDLAFDSGG